MTVPRYGSRSSNRLPSRPTHRRCTAGTRAPTLLVWLLLSELDPRWPPPRRGAVSGPDIMSDMAAKFSGVLLDFAGTLFDQEDERETLRAIGVPAPESAGLALALSRADRLAATPALMPPGLARQWERRDLTQEAHRAAYATLLREAGLPPDVADAFYARACSPQAWLPFDDASVMPAFAACPADPGRRDSSNIGWDLRPCLRPPRCGVPRRRVRAVVRVRRHETRGAALFRGLRCARCGPGRGAHGGRQRRQRRRGHRDRLHVLSSRHATGPGCAQASALAPVIGG